MPRGGPAQEVIAEIVRSGRGAAARPAFAPGEEIRMGPRSLGDARLGDLATVVVRGRSARVVRVFGPSRAPGAVMAALLAGEGKGWGFPRAVEREVAAIEEGDPLADPGRRDLTAQDVVTIDPQGAKDHDDAIAAAPEGPHVRLWVHIADVAHYVPAGGDVDAEAERRGCSVYVPGTVDPMLPARLSSDLCSLRPGVARRAVTAEMLVDGDGEVVESRFYRSVIRSERRLTYPEVDAHIAGAPLGHAGMEATVAAAREVSRRLRRRRMGRGALEIASGEPQFELADDRVAGVHIEEQTESHRLVEDCMIAANEAVARYLIQRTRPTLFRHHDDPDQRRVERLYGQLEALGVATPPYPDRAMAPAELRQAAGAAGEAVARHLAALPPRVGAGRSALWYLVLRSLKQAYYTPDHVTHSGLASAAYLHFTSPIRRYPDLVVHRTLLDALGLGPAGPGRDELEMTGFDSSESERAAADIERRADRICGALLLEQRLRGDWDEVFAGEVTGVIPQGAFVAFGEAFEGFLPARALADGDLVTDEYEVALEGPEGDVLLRIGDPVAVRVIDVTPLRGRTRLERADAPAPAGARRSRAARRRSRIPR
jgi:ribonuclease R